MSSSGRVPDSRVRALNERPTRPDADFVLYWMAAARRLDWNFGLQHAVEIAGLLGKPLVIFEPLRLGRPWASTRFHRRVMDGMLEHSEKLEDTPVCYYPYVEMEEGGCEGLLDELAKQSCVVISDDYPCAGVPQAHQALADRSETRLEVVDGSGLIPMRAVERAYPSAYHFRRALQKTLPDHLERMPLPNPLAELPPADELLSKTLDRWPATKSDKLRSDRFLRELPIDQSVGVVAEPGGSRRAVQVLERFLDDRLQRYAEERNDPSAEVTSGLSAALHLGHISAHRVFDALAERESWNPGELSPETTGKRSGWWGMSHSAESFLDELVTWRELGFNMCAHRDDYDRYESLPEWARETLELHQDDDRPHLYSLNELEEASTADPLWNAAQRELRREGRIQGYLRMLWGKKILEWSPDPRLALDAMIQLNNKYAIDGRDPNSYSGIFWILGRYDRPWPERPVFGKVRTMTSDSARRKFNLEGYLDRFGTET